MSTPTPPPVPGRPKDGHKGTFGRLLIVGGSTGMSGAPALCGMAALRSGAGLVTVAVPHSLLNNVAGFEASYLTCPLMEDTHGRIAANSEATIWNQIENMNAAAIGPGLGQSSELTTLTANIYTEAEIPMVFDADALNALANLETPLKLHAGPRILTPHPGEFSRLTGKSIAEIQQDREATAIEFARNQHVTLVLKGPGTVVTDGEQTAINTTGNSGMGTGGTGDVLTGMIVSLLAQGMPVFEAARLATYVHGLAGDLAADELTERAMIASDLIRYLPKAWKTLEASSQA